MRQHLGDWNVTRSENALRQALEVILWGEVCRSET
jgi:hypothetical protein